MVANIKFFFEDAYLNTYHERFVYLLELFLCKIFIFCYSLLRFCIQGAKMIRQAIYYE